MSFLLSFLYILISSQMGCFLILLLLLKNDKNPTFSILVHFFNLLFNEQEQ